MKKDYIKFGKNRNSRFILTKESVSYTTEKNNTICKGRFTITFRGKDIIKYLEVTGYCKKAKDDKENTEFARRLARVRMEKAAYEKFKAHFGYITMADLHRMLIQDYSKHISICCVLYYVMNSIHFADNMIKHQKEYIKKLVYEPAPKNCN